MKRIIALLLALSLIFVSVGCSKDSSNPEVEEQGENTENTSIEVDKKLTNVEITLPASLFESDEEEELDIDQITEDAKEQDIKSVTLNEDGSITYSMPKAIHKELIVDMGNDISDSIDELINDEDIYSIKDVISNKNFSEFEVVVNREEFENSFDGFAVLGLVFQSMYYQLFEGVEPDNYKVLINYKDEGTGEIFNSVTYPDAFDE